MSSPDPISLTALIISLVALILTLLQVAQQYIATASDYRHCSKRTIGGWHRKSRRQFLWSELRFEVKFSTPIISVGIVPSYSTNRETYAVPTSVPEKSSHDDSSASPASGAQYILHTSDGDKTYNSSEKPWFLDVRGTRLEAQCTWLSLLNNATIARLQIGIDERALSYDFMPDGIKKPLAQMDRKSFLTLMSLFQVSWQDGWREIKGKRETPTGAGPYCEVTSRNLINFGTVISYRPSQLQSPRRFYIVSEKAQSAMFNCFKLEFHTVYTHSADEVYRSALELADESVATALRGCYQVNNAWVPGLAEVISCFAEPEMPKAVEHGTDTFLSIFSSRSLGSIFDDHSVSRLLEGDWNIENSNSDANKFAGWAEAYISSSLSVGGGTVRLPADKLREALKIASTYLGTQAEQRRPISWSESRKCLDVIRLLDQHSSILCRLLAPNHYEHEVHRNLAQLQIRLGSKLLSDTSAKAQPSGWLWREFIGVVVAENYVQICSSMAEKHPGNKDKVIQDYVINRMMRGLLWRIHNGNRSSDGNAVERLMECSLDSLWLSDSSTLWID